MPLQVNGFTAHVCCDGKEMEAHSVQSDGTNIVSCWIASETGREFIVHWGDDTASATLQVDVRMDGRLVDRQAHENSATGRSLGVVEIPGQRLPYQFAPLVLTDDDSVASSKVAPDDNLGLIEITMRTVDHFVQTENHYSVGKVSKIGPLHEKSKKAGVHAVSLGESQNIQKSRSLTACGLKQEPVAMFRFRYRPLALLQANGVAPLPPKPPRRGKKRPSDAQGSPAAGPSNSKRQRAETSDDDRSDSDDDEEDRVNFLQEQIVLLQDQLAREQAKQKPRDAVKREPSPIQLPDGDNDIIDLTVDREASPTEVLSGEDDIIDLT